MTLDNTSWDDETFTEDGKRCTYFARDQGQNVLDATIIATSQMAIIEAAVEARNPALAEALESIRCRFTNFAVSHAWGRLGRQCAEFELVPGMKQVPCEE